MLTATFDNKNKSFNHDFLQKFFEQFWKNESFKLVHLSRVETPGTEVDSLFSTKKDDRAMKNISSKAVQVSRTRLWSPEGKAISIIWTNQFPPILLAAKERDFNLYYNQYQNIAKEFEDFKAKISQPMTVEPLEEMNSGQIDETLSETMLFAIPESDATENSSATIIANNNEDSMATRPSKPNFKPRKIIRASKRSRISTSSCDGPSKKISKSSSIPKYFKCSICPKEDRGMKHYDDIHDYRNHVIQIHPKRFLCDRCPYHASSQIDLKRHTQNVHSPSITSVGFDCALCNISYSRMNLLNQHINLYH